MEWLTKRESNGCSVPLHGDAGWYGKIVARLAAIEDILGDEYDLERLRELVDADRAGKCVILPDSYYRDERAAMKAREKE